jgi:tetratricopeptide (TPR) repeat protein
MLLPLGLPLMLCLCYHGAVKNDRLAYVGSTLVTQQDADAFGTASRYYPTPAQQFSISTRPTVSGLIETQAIYNRERGTIGALKLEHSLGWKWKERYYTSVLFAQSILQMNYGFTDAELLNYYKNHSPEFATTPPPDSTGKKKAAFLKPFDEVKPMVAEKMFKAKYPPDSEFRVTFPLKDTAALERQWLKYAHEEGCPFVFQRMYYREKYGRSLPDSLKDFCGPGKIISQDDVDLILSWLPADRRDAYKNNPLELKNLALWLVRWKLFSDKAQELGFSAKPTVRNVIDWALRYELAQNFITESIAPQARRGVTIDTAMARYSFLDESDSPVASDTARFNSHLTRLLDREVNVKFDSLIYELRRAAHVRFIKNDWKDELVNDPARLLRRADSLRDTGNVADAQNAYRTLVENFFFSKEGRKAILELAKMKTEQQLYSDAIKDYRRALVVDADPGKVCNTMFMIGFIYDEYLNKPDMAEVNYKWVLKNAPDCELIDDAEFMMLHLGEQMASVDELQAEVKRQGKKVEPGVGGDSSGLKGDQILKKKI